MNRTDLLRSLENLLDVEQGSLKETAPLADMPQWDSMAIMGYIAVVQGSVGIVLEGEQVTKARTVGELLQLAVHALED